MKIMAPAAMILEASGEAGQGCVGLGRPVGFAASSIDRMRRSIPEAYQGLFAVGNEGDCMKRGTSSQRKVDFYRAANEQCARIVLADIACCGEEGSLMVRWAWAVLAQQHSEKSELSLWGKHHVQNNKT